ncbi:MAG TPA: hypothetical protein VMV41_13905 [Cellulomonadaceae bacterium]|nr:hypothetical protein [Cellulomonadaceae bacterium]
MRRTHQDQHVPARSPEHALLGRAWTAVALIPVFFFVAFALGYVLYDVLGYLPENNDAPFWVNLVATIPTLAVFLIPCVAAVVLGSRVVRSGDRRGVVPLAVGSVAGGWLAIVSVVGLVSGGA